MGLSVRIRTARRYAHFSQIQLAEQLGISRSAVANWECTNPGNPATSRLEKMAMVLGVSYEWLATGRGSMTCLLQPSESAIEAVYAHTHLQERRLLNAFRDAPDRARLLILEMAEFHTKPQGPGSEPPPPPAISAGIQHRW